MSHFGWPIVRPPQLSPLQQPKHNDSPHEREGNCHHKIFLSEHIHSCEQTNLKQLLCRSRQSPPFAASIPIKQRDAQFAGYPARTQFASLRLLDEFGVSCSQSNGVFASFERDGDVPDEASIGAPSAAKDEVRTGRDRGDQGGFARAIQGGFPNVVLVHGAYEGFALFGRKAVGGPELQCFAGSSVGWNRCPGFAESAI